MKNRLWFGIFLALFVWGMWQVSPASEPLAASAPPGPLTGKIICLDPGHGGYDGGARARDSGVGEKVINLQVALKARTALESLGAQVVMTRWEDQDLSHASQKGNTQKRRDMNARLERAQAAGADMLLSIHMNEYRQRSSSGPQVFYTQGNEASRLLAGCPQKSLIDTLKPAKERSALAGDYYILRLPIPSCLVECGFISNPEEEKKLLSDAYQTLLGEAIAQGAADFFELQSRRDMIQ
ncbi:MAG: N-acetylmuramoyl-L-alanine amidase [Clostridia bacterium]|nr:N-acetylmuramoyl-L-alanine amidase [Clostridia bacterium]